MSKLEQLHDVEQKGDNKIPKILCSLQLSRVERTNHFTFYVSAYR